MNSSKLREVVEAITEDAVASYASNPFDVMTEDFKIEAERLDAAADGLLREFLAALAKVAP